MRCRGCDYRLWNIASRKCPECGAAFLPSQYEFVPNSVQFCCPHCRQPYYGTGPRGALVPAAFNCVKCNAPIAMDEMVLLPAAGVEEDSTEPRPMPWLDRAKLGRFRAWFQTVKLSLTRPGELIESTPARAGTGDAMRFVAMNSLVSITVMMGLVFVIPFAFVLFGRPGSMRGAGFGLLAFPVVVAGATLCQMFMAFVWSWAAHGVLRLTGETASGRARTAQGIYYGSGGNLLTLVPCLGAYFGWIGWVVSATMMVRRGQRVSGLRAAFATAGPPVVALVLFVTVYVGFLFLGISSGRFVTTRPAVVLVPLPSLQAIVDHARSHGGKAPRHIAELLWGGTLLPDELVASGLDSDAEQIAIGSTTIGQMQSMPLSQRESVINQFVSSLPSDRKPYRFGDYVFAHEGVVFNGTNSQMWVIIEWPVGQTPTFVRIGRADGSTTALPMQQFLSELIRQNALRTSMGLELIPLPLLSPAGRS